MTGIVLHQYGTPGAPTLLLVHGLTDSSECWPDAVAHWGDRWRVLTVDQRGHGHSPRFTEDNVGRSTEVWRDDLIAVLRDLDEPPVSIGHSLGGMTALRAAEAAPELVRALVLEDPARPTTAHGPDQEFVDWYLALIRDFDAAAETARLHRETPWSDAEIAAWAVAKPQVDPLMIRKGLDLHSGPWEETFQELSVPTLVLGPIDSDMMPEPALIDNPLVRIEFLEGVGHCVRRDGPGTYFAMVDEFLAALPEG